MVRLGRSWVLLLPATLLLGFFFLAPMGQFMVVAFRKDVGLGQLGPVGLYNMARIFSDAFYMQVLADTLLLAIYVAVLTVAVSFPVAYILVRRGRTVRRVVLPLLMVSSFISSVIRAMGWVIALGTEGYVNRLLAVLQLPGAPYKFLNSTPGVVLGMIHFLLPVVVLNLMSVLNTIPVSLEAAAASLGAPRLRIFTRVILPLSLPGVISSFLLIFSLTTSVFTTIILLGGGNVLTLPVVVYQEIVSKTKYGMGAALALVMVVMVFLVNYLTYMLTRRFMKGVRQP